MSYILDALKKADAEREREGVPSLQTQHVAHPAPLDGSDDAAAVGLKWAAAGVAGGLVLLAGLWWLSPGAEGSAEGSAAAHQSLNPAQGNAQVPPPSALPVPAPVTPPSIAVAPPVSAQARTGVQPLPQPPMPAAPPTEPPRREGSRKADAGIQVDASLRDAPVRVVPVAELPEDVRRELPALSIGGAMHSDVPASRMLILNGSVFHEGDQPAPGLVLEEIKLKSAVFRFKGHRYSVAY